MSPELKARLLRIAREALEHGLAGSRGRPPDFSDWPTPQPQGAFVTLRHGRRLRGCIGTFCPRGRLPETVWEMAVAAADDPRFADDPVALDELPALRIEISVLSPLERTADPATLAPGVHGIYLRARGTSGCFLPQVATEFGWTPEEFLSRCCTEKAHLPADAWRDPKTEVFLFTVEKIEEPAPAAGAAPPASCGDPGSS